MPETFLAPGVHVQELPPGPRTIDGVPTSVALFVAVATDGPVGQPVRVLGPGEAARGFGVPGSANPLADALAAFFANGGRVAWALRPVDDATLAPDSAAFLVALESLSAPGGVIDTMAPFNLLVVPGLTDVPSIARLQALCARLRGFLILDSPPDADPVSVLAHAHALSASPDARNSALYFPWLRVLDPDAPDAERSVPPSAAVAGVYARVDEARGVFQVPAGTGATLRGVVGIGYPIDDAVQGPLNVDGVNALRLFPQYGPLVWGARTLAAASFDWRYVPVRRTVQFIEASLVAGLEWVAFERNDDVLWTAVRLGVARFLDGLWRAGAFAGASADEAFSVQCGRGITMTDDDVSAGRLRLSVMVALTHPAEFIVLTLEMRTAAP